MSVVPCGAVDSRPLLFTAEPALETIDRMEPLFPAVVDAKAEDCDGDGVGRDDLTSTTLVVCNDADKELLWTEAVVSALERTTPLGAELILGSASRVDSKKSREVAVTCACELKADASCREAPLCNDIVPWTSEELSGSFEVEKGTTLEDIAGRAETVAVVKATESALVTDEVRVSRPNVIETDGATLEGGGNKGGDTGMLGIVGIDGGCLGGPG